MILLDTHVVIWLVNGVERSKPAARDLIAQAAAAGGVHVSAITAWEVALLVRKGRLALGREPAEWIDGVLALPGVRLAQIDDKIAVESVALPEWSHGDPADRFIVATARHHSWRLMTADNAILAYGADGRVDVIDAEH